MNVFYGIFGAISIIAKTLHAYCSHVRVLIINVFTFRVSRRPREMYYGHARLCVCPWPHAHTIARTWM